MDGRAKGHPGIPDSFQTSRRGVEVNSGLYSQLCGFLQLNPRNAGHWTFAHRASPKMP
jgi:hypothetical protein